ncbi:hypothetical protein F4604DRAFT_2004007 [Suillus subluteus]|nr:hypothetical protein F4604DRAFT_2004007 [Suillus subluteus]
MFRLTLIDLWFGKHSWIATRILNAAKNHPSIAHAMTLAMATDPAILPVDKKPNQHSTRVRPAMATYLPMEFDGARNIQQTKEAPSCAHTPNSGFDVLKSSSLTRIDWVSWSAFCNAFKMLYQLSPKLPARKRAQDTNTLRRARFHSESPGTWICRDNEGKACEKREPAVLNHRIHDYEVLGCRTVMRECGEVKSGEQACQSFEDVERRRHVQWTLGRKGITYYEDLRIEDSREQTRADSLFRDEATAPTLAAPSPSAENGSSPLPSSPEGSSESRTKKTALLYRNQRRFLMTGTIFYDVHQFHERLHRWSHVYSENSQPNLNTRVLSTLPPLSLPHPPYSAEALSVMLACPLLLRPLGSGIAHLNVIGIHSIKLVLLLVPDSAFHMGKLVILIGKIWYGFLWFGHLNASLHQYHDHAT